MKIIKSNMLENHEGIEYLYIFYNLVHHIVSTRATKQGRRLDLAERRISTREDRAEFLTGFYLDEAFPIVSRLQAVHLLGKTYGDYLERVVLQKDKVEMPVININLENIKDEL